MDGALPDLVNAPPHYRTGRIETIDVIEDWVADPGAHLGVAIKYLSRAGKKDGAPVWQDIAKARWYVARAREWIARGGRCAAWDRSSMPKIGVQEVVEDHGITGHAEVALSYIAQTLYGPTFADHWLGLAITQLDIEIRRLTRETEAV